MPDLTHEHLRWLLRCQPPGWYPHPEADDWLSSVPFARLEPEDEYGEAYVLTPAGQALVDIALRAVNAELRSRK